MNNKKVQEKNENSNNINSNVNPDNLKKSEMDVLKKTDKETPKTKLKNDTEEVSNLSKTSPLKTRKEERKSETVDDLKLQLNTLMNSLATLSAEKSKMEAQFQIDKKQLRSDREENEKVIKDLKDKLKYAQNNSHSEMEHLKYKLIMERHEREKEHSDHSAIMKELQKVVNNERRIREQLEGQIKDLKGHVSNKSQNKVLEAELEIMKNKLKHAEAAAKETPPLLLSLQAEMTAMKKQHRSAIHDEQKKATAAQQHARALAMVHEKRVASLEARLAELSETVGGYDRARQQDQQAIQKLKDQLTYLENIDYSDHFSNDFSKDPKKIVSNIREQYTLLMNLDREHSFANVKDLLNSLNLSDASQDHGNKYESLLEEFEELKRQKVVSSNNTTKNEMANSFKNSNENSNECAQLQRIKTHNKNLEERIRLLNEEIAKREQEFKVKLENQHKILQDERIKYERLMNQKDNEYRGKIVALEHQLLRQRERSLAVINEKDQEILTLKSSFQALLPNKGSSFSDNKIHHSSVDVNSEPSADLVTGLLTTDNNPPMLHYAQELARREIEVSNLRKQNVELEAMLREKQRDLFHETERHKDELKKLQSQITRLEACKSREGANLEYLKNVIVNYLITSDPSSKRHMLNAISTVLHFTAEETEKIRRVK
ncbi:GRIP and coiled-coil domain-containing protein 1 [Leptopilina boulardi]|uniref:GRIP and coiled-coil domain-containing protein 1 n=1 Tax=Leptopilina boulardi TaxID=63433 RepID=UPI0021F656D7|nr:GRIP and coiled-coil domain-containing protein 1 [Leptopilina boulardi]XP_051176129.1 GRIP and coiled-coil domain-containing protein 1 [Leptopilina boulardi]